MQLSWNLAIIIYAAAYAVFAFRVSRNPGASLTVLLLAALTFASCLFMAVPMYSIIILYALVLAVFAFRFGDTADKLVAMAFSTMNLFQCLWVIGRLRSGLAAQGLSLADLLRQDGNEAVLDALFYDLGRNFAVFLAGLLIAFLGRRGKRKGGSGGDPI